MSKGKTRVLRSSGNVFADLKVSNAEEKQTKIRLAVAINQVLERKRLSQAKAAGMLKINQPKVSALVNYQLAGFSVERLMTFLNALGQEIEIVIRRPRSGRTARIHVTAA